MFFPSFPLLLSRSRLLSLSGLCPAARKKRGQTGHGASDRCGRGSKREPADAEVKRRLSLRGEELDVKYGGVRAGCCVYSTGAVVHTESTQRHAGWRLHYRLKRARASRRPSLDRRKVQAPAHLQLSKRRWKYRLNTRSMRPGCLRAVMYSGVSAGNHPVSSDYGPSIWNYIPGKSCCSPLTRLPITP